MTLLAATHSGKFHADDVLAWALLRLFHSRDTKLVRRREPYPFEQADIVFDVGGFYDPERMRFDHHQKEYEGELSSAGMVLDWLHGTGKVEDALYGRLKDRLVDYVDDVDNGRREPIKGVPCFASIVGAFNSGCTKLEDYDRAFQKASSFAEHLVGAITWELEEEKSCIQLVMEYMQEARSKGSNVIEFPNYVKWQGPFFKNGGIEHPADFVVFPTMHGTWQAVCIPPIQGSFGQKVPFPASWGGLRDTELEKATGVPGAVFCHKNRFIAVFKTREGLYEAMERAGLLSGPI
jgi:uncharacterized UPF0160 family protein